MPSSMHEVLVEIFRQRPALAAELLTDALGIELPVFGQARLEPADCVDLAPTEYRADAVVVLSQAARPVRAVVVEVQLRRDDDKLWTWPVYLHTLRARLRCPTLLLVVCVDEATAAWAATRIELGQPGSTLTPLVIGPDRVPVFTDAAPALRAPELAVLSALAHGRDPRRSEVLDVLADALAGVETQQAVLYLRLVLAALPQAARIHLEELMTTGTYEYQSEFTERLRNEGAARGEAKGRAEAKADDVLRVLRARGVEVPDDVRARIVGCTDLERLDAWLDRASTAHSVDDLGD
ncbi:MAG: hypothetical protein ACRDRK_09270 [Pseudonocardia sp.]